MARPIPFSCLAPSRRRLVTLLLATATLLAHGLAAAESTGSSRSLFDGESLKGWKPSAFDSQAAVKVENPFREGTAAIILERSNYLSGITWTNEADIPRMNYEITLEAMKLEGHDFFCGLTFPVGDTAVTFVVGGWGGMVTGISCVDNSDASDNDTSTAKEYKPNQWYKVRVRVTPGRLDAWIDNEKMVELETTGRKLDLRFGEIKNSLPLGIAAFETRAALRNIQLRRLTPEEAKP
jgi:hypothetical protein